jgi:hypothetical protein
MHSAEVVEEARRFLDSLASSSSSSAASAASERVSTRRAVDHLSDDAENGDEDDEDDSETYERQGSEQRRSYNQAARKTSPATQNGLVKTGAGSSVLLLSRSKIEEAAALKEKKDRLHEWLEVGRSNRTFGRARGDGRVKLNSALTAIHEALSAFDRRHGSMFKLLVDPAQAPGYYQLVQQPMDLATIRARLDNAYYCKADDYLRDVRLIETASSTYNGSDASLTRLATTLSEIAAVLIAEKEDDLKTIEIDIVNHDVFCVREFIFSSQFMNGSLLNSFVFVLELDFVCIRLC